MKKILATTFAIIIVFTSLTIMPGLVSVKAENLPALYFTDSNGKVCIEGISEETFVGHIDIPNSIAGQPVTSIGYAAFRDTSITSITIPASVTSISYSAFEWCYNLSDVYYSGTQQQKSRINIGSYNEDLLNSTWHYNYIPCNHSSTILKNERDATCTKTGYTGNVACADCGIVLSYYGKTIPALGHNYNGVVTPPTCIEEGYTTYTCLRCGDSYKDSYTDMTSHNYEIINNEKICKYCKRNLCLNAYYSDILEYGTSINKEKIKVLYKNTVLTENVDYTVKCENYDSKVIVDILCSEDYNDLSYSFEIVKAPRDLSKAYFENIENEFYIGRPITPVPTIKYDNNILILDQDYKLQYQNNVDVGEAKIIAIGIGNYKGSIETSFNIIRKSDTNETKHIILKDGVTPQADGTGMIEVSKGTTIEGIVKIVKHNSFIATFVMDEITNVETSEHTRIYSKVNNDLTRIDANVNDFKFKYTFNKPGIYVLTYSWEEGYLKSNYNNGIYSGYTEVYSGIKRSGAYGIIVQEEELGTVENPDTPVLATQLIPKEPIFQDIRTVYLDIGTKNANEKISDVQWSSSDNQTAQVVDGKVTLNKSGSVTITATANGKNAKWVLDLEKLDLTKKGKILSYDNNHAIVTFDNELLIEGVDYKLETETKGEAVIVIVKGINLFDGELKTAFCKDSNCLYYCEHIYSDDYDNECDFCYEKRTFSYTPGDIDGVDGITDADAVYLLMHTFFPDDYPVNQNCDFNGDGIVTDADAVYLLMFTFFPEDYPLH